jgi:hypothetical protein
MSSSDADCEIIIGEDGSVLNKYINQLFSLSDAEGFVGADESLFDVTQCFQHPVLFLDKLVRIVIQGSI